MKKNKIAIFLNYGHGDIMTAMSVLKYKDILWPNSEIVWFCSPSKYDLLKFAPVELRPWEDFKILLENKNEDCTLNHDFKHYFKSLDDIDIGYFPAPWQYSPDHPARKDIDYPNISKKIFKVDPNLEWHPQLYFSKQEEEMIKDFCLSLPYKKTIMIETDYNSGQSLWDDSITFKTIEICKNKFKNCNVILSSKSDYSNFLNIDGVVSASNFTLRQAALINNYADLFIGVSSGLSVAVNCWGNKPTPKIQYANTFYCSTQSLANGPFNLIKIHENNNHKEEYYNTLIYNLNNI